MSKLGLTRGSQIYTNREAGTTVYSGTIQHHGVTPVAIKEQYHQHLLSVNCFFSESIAQAKLFHPNICRLFEAYLEQDQHSFMKSVLVMELMDKDMNKEITQRAAVGAHWSEEELIRYLKDLAGALEYAQQMEISHRDVKPQNIFMSGGVVKLGDFGSSKMNIEAITRTMQGTPFYLSPELKQNFTRIMAGGKEETVYDPYKSDVYSLGLTFVCMRLLTIPIELANLTNLEKATVTVLGRIAEHRILQEALARMLCVSVEQRWSFAAILEFTQFHLDRCANPAIAVSLPAASDHSIVGQNDENRPAVKQEEVYKCANCKVIRRATEQSAAQLICLHKFHSMDCFIAFIREQKEAYQCAKCFFCPICDKQIMLESLPDSHRNRALNILKPPAECIICRKEDSNGNRHYEECHHWTCRMCDGAKRPETCPNCTDITTHP